MKHLKFRVKQVLSFISTVALVVLLIKQYNTEKIIKERTIIMYDTITYVPPQPTIITP